MAFYVGLRVWQFKHLHCTIAYSPDNDFLVAANVAASYLHPQNMYMAEVDRIVNNFGPGKNLTVVKLRPKGDVAALSNLFKFCNKSQYTFNPHITLGDGDDWVLQTIHFDKLYVKEIVK